MFKTKINRRWNTRINKNIQTFGILEVISFVVACIFLTTSSPLFQNFVVDYVRRSSAENLIMAQLILQGKLPYKDFFVTDGPLLYYLEAFFYAIGKRNGIFLMQIIALACFLYLTLCFLGTSLNQKCTWITIIFIVIGWGATISSGNIAESIYVPLLMLIIYLLFHTKNMVLIGVLTAFSLAISWLYTLPIILFTIILNFSNAKKFWLKYLFGLSLVTFPIFIWLQLNNMTSDFMEAVIFYQWDAWAHSGHTINELIRKTIKSLPAIVLIFFSVYNLFKQEHNKTEHLSWLLLSISYSIIAIGGNGEWQSYAIMIVIFIITIRNIMLINNNLKLKTLGGICAGLLYGIIMLIPFISYTKYVYNLLTTDDYNYELTYIMENIEEKLSENTNLLVIDASPAIYLISDTLPEYKYFSNQSKLCRMQRFRYVMEDIQEYACETPDILIQSGSGLVLNEYGMFLLSSIDNVGHFGKIAFYEKLE